MRDRKGIVLCILIGSFCVYCGQSVMTEMSHGTTTTSASGGTTAVGNAMGDACCTPPGRETLTVLFDDLVSPAPIAGHTGECTMTTPTLQVSDFRTVVIHTPQCSFMTQFRNGKAGFVQGPSGICDTVYGASNLGRALTVDSILGHEMRVNLVTNSTVTVGDPDGSASCGNPPVPVTIVGYKNP